MKYKNKQILNMIDILISDLKIQIYLNMTNKLLKKKNKMIKKNKKIYKIV